MKRLFVFICVLIGSILGFPCLAQPENGAALFTQHCASCHGQEQHPRIAPPLMGIRKHLRQAFPEEEDFIAHVVNWLQNPDPETALIKHAVEQFGAMPALTLEDEQAIAIAHYLFNGDHASGPGGEHSHMHQDGCQGCGKQHGNHSQAR